MIKKASSRVPEFLSSFKQYTDSVFHKLLKRSEDVYLKGKYERSNIFKETDPDVISFYSSIYGLESLESNPYRGIEAQIISEKMFGTPYSYTLPFYMLGYPASLFLLDSLNSQINLPEIIAYTLEDYVSLLDRMYERWDYYDWSGFFGGISYDWDSSLRYNQEGVWDRTTLNYVRGDRFVAVDPNTPLQTIEYFRTNFLERNNPLGSTCEWGYYYHPNMIPYFEIPGYAIKDENVKNLPLTHFSILEVVRRSYSINVEPFSRKPLSYLVSDEIVNNYIGTYRGGTDIMSFETVPEGFDYKLTIPSNRVISLQVGDLKVVGENSFVEFRQKGEIVITLGYVKDSQVTIGSLEAGKPITNFNLPIYFFTTYAKRNFVTFVFEDTYYISSPAVLVDGDEGRYYLYHSTALDVDITYDPLLNEFKISRMKIEKLVCNYTESVDSDQRGDFFLSWKDFSEVVGINLRSIPGDLLGSFTKYSTNKNQRLLLFSEGKPPPRQGLGKAGQNQLGELELNKFKL